MLERYTFALYVILNILKRDFQYVFRKWLDSLKLTVHALTISPVYCSLFEFYVQVV